MGFKHPFVIRYFFQLYNQIRLLVERSIFMNIYGSSLIIIKLCGQFVAPSANHELLNLQQCFNNDYADGWGGQLALT
jgi:hypothetical protein